MTPMTDAAATLEPDAFDALATLVVSLVDRHYDEMPWRVDAACRGEDRLFFAPPGERPENAQVREALAVAICDGCPVREPCRAYARRHREYGVWGGETELDRAWKGYGVDMPVGSVARAIEKVGRRPRPRSRAR